MNRLSKIILAFVGIILLIVGLILIIQNNKNMSTNTPYGTSTTSTKSSTPKSSESTGAIVQTKTDSTIGTYLTDEQGNTLHTYGADSAGVSNCTGSCLANWPAYVSNSSSTAKLPTNVGVIKRADNGKNQYTYKISPSICSSMIV